jgi:hypothetical protein
MRLLRPRFEPCLTILRAFHGGGAAQIGSESGKVKVFCDMKSHAASG